MKKPDNKSNQFRQVVELKSTFTKPLGSMEKARRNVEWTTARGMNTFPTRHWVMKGHTSAQIDRNSKKKKTERNSAEKEGTSTRQAAEWRGGEGRPSHIGRGTHTHTRSSDSEHLVVSWWCKF